MERTDRGSCMPSDENQTYQTESLPGPGKGKLYCESHQDEDLRFFCLKTRKLVCIKCAFELSITKDNAKMFEIKDLVKHS